MKPLFEKERLFLQNKLGVIIPKFCWKNPENQIFLNCDDKNYIINFKVKDGKLVLGKYLNDIVVDEETIKIDNSSVKVTTWEEEYQKFRKVISYKYNESKEMLKAYLLKYTNAEVRPSVSGGKDSDLAYFISKVVLDELNRDFKTDMFNTTNDTAQTFKHVMGYHKNINIHTPEIAWYPWLAKVKNYYLPTVMTRNCCSTFKEGQLTEVLDHSKEYVITVGIRKSESPDRAKYDWDINESVKKMIKKGKPVPLNVPENWHRFAIIINWTDPEVWLFLLHYKLKFNVMYELGFNRVGCLICPYSRPYIDILCKEYYSFLWKRWEYALEQNYNLYNVKRRLKWSMGEWKNGAWKEGISKEYRILKLKPTPERVKIIADLKGISLKMAKKYFKRTCTKCGKSLNPDEVAMNFKLNGRFADMPDEMEVNRIMLCKKCTCEHNGWKTKVYEEKVRAFRNSECTLF